jgi:hypothetical protein
MNRRGGVGAEKKVGLARALSKMGICSRSDAGEMIRAGRVKVNGAVVSRIQDLDEYTGYLALESTSSDGIAFRNLRAIRLPQSHEPFGQGAHKASEAGVALPKQRASAQPFYPREPFDALRREKPKHSNEESWIVEVYCPESAEQLKVLLATCTGHGRTSNGNVSTFPMVGVPVIVASDDSSSPPWSSTTGTRSARPRRWRRPTLR